jgi:hypothetical protein
MPREVPVAPRQAAAGIARRFLLLAALAMLPQAVAAGSLSASIEIAQAKWKTVRLKNMPKDASVMIQVESSGSIRVAFVHGDEVKRFPAPVTPEFQGKVDGKLSFGVSIPRAGDYYLILDNRQGEEARKIRLLIRAEKPKPPDNAPARPAGGKAAETRI